MDIWLKFYLILSSVSVLVGFIFLFQHVRYLMNRKTIVLPPLSSVRGGIKIFDLSKDKTMAMDNARGLVIISIAALAVTVGGGGLVVEYFVTKSHLMSRGMFISLVTLVVLGFAGFLSFCSRGIRYFLKTVELTASTRGKEIIFDETKVSFSVGLVESVHSNKLIDHGRSYLEIPYASVKAIEVLPATSSSRSTIPARLKFDLHGEDHSPTIKRTPLGENEGAIVEELRKRITVPIVVKE